MTATTSSGTNGMQTLSTNLIAEDAGEGGGHADGDEESDGSEYR